MKLFKCETCGYETKRKFNLELHLNKKSPCIPCINNTQCDNNVNNKSYLKGNVNIMMNHNQNIDICDQNINKTSKDENKCKLCNKCLSSKSFLKKHEKKCNGLHKLQCPTCLKFFASASSKSTHIKNAKCKPPDDLISKDDLKDKIIKLNEDNELISLKLELKKAELMNQNLQLRINQIENNSEEFDFTKQSKNQFTPSQKKTIAFNQGYKCKVCDIFLPPDFEIDHIISRADGGTNDLSNGQALCKVCHEKKTYQENVSRKLFKKNISLNEL